MKHKFPRLTKQRAVLLEELRKCRLHPTADEVFEIVRRRLPRISLATVYRNLELLAEAGEARVLANADGPKRYDGDVRPHLHIRCGVCGRVADVHGEVRVSWRRLVLPVGYRVLDYSVDLVGLCPRCAKQGNRTRNNKV